MGVLIKNSAQKQKITCKIKGVNKNVYIFAVTNRSLTL